MQTFRFPSESRVKSVVDTVGGAGGMAACASCTATREDRALSCPWSRVSTKFTNVLSPSQDTPDSLRFPKLDCPIS